MTTGCSTCARLGPFLLAWVLGGLSLHTASAQGRSGSNALVVPDEVVLQPTAVPFDLEGFGGSINKQARPFPKEPELGQGPAFRWMLRFGKDTNNAIALLWDWTNGKLYFDLNRNLDLSDDPAGVFASPHAGHFTQTFTNVILPLKTAEGLHPAILQFKLSSEREGSWSQVQVTSRSVWQAKVAPGGEEWQVAVLDSLLGREGPIPGKFLLVRKWADRTNYLSLRDSRSGLVPFPDRLFWLGWRLHPECRFETSNGAPVCRLKFTHQPAPMTEVNFSRESLYYAVLRDTNGYTVVMSERNERVTLPRGLYAVSTAWLKKGEAKAWLLPDQRLTINALTPTNVVLGGPLTNSVTLARRGRRLSMEYQLVGAGGGLYRLAQQDRDKPPEFTVYHGGRKVFSGKFQYG